MRTTLNQSCFVLCGLTALLTGCGSNLDQFKHLKFLVGEWESTGFHRTCTLTSSTNEDLLWDEIVQWSGNIAITGARTTTLSSNVLSRYDEDGQHQLTIGTPTGDRLHIASPERATLRINDHHYIGPIQAVVDKNSVTIPPTILRKGREEVFVEGSLEIPHLLLKANEPLDVEVTPTSTFTGLPELSSVTFDPRGMVTFMTPNQDRLEGYWSVDGIHLKLQKATWKNKSVLLRAKRFEKTNMKLSEEIELPPSSISLHNKTLQVRCTQTQRFKSR